MTVVPVGSSEIFRLSWGIPVKRNLLSKMVSAEILTPLGLRSSRKFQRPLDRCQLPLGMHSKMLVNWTTRRVISYSSSTRANREGD